MWILSEWAVNPAFPPELQLSQKAGVRLQMGWAEVWELFFFSLISSLFPPGQAPEQLQAEMFDPVMLGSQTAVDLQTVAPAPKSVDKH